MKINYKGNFEQVKLAVDDANEILYSNEIYELIRQRENFNCTEKTPSELADILQRTNLEVEVKVYKPRWRFSKVLGYFVKNKPNNVFLNSRKLFRDTSSITNTIVHEYVHAVDNEYDISNTNFGHNCDILKNSAPYVIGNIAEIIIDGYDISEIDSSLRSMENNNVSQCLADDRHLFIENESIIEESRIY